MKKIITLTIYLTLGIVYHSLGQIATNKRELKKQVKLDRANELRTLLENQYFYVDNFQLFDRNQNTKLLSASNNFIKFSGNDLLIQTSFSNVNGINGLGGLTLQGRIIDYEISDVGQKGPINVQVLFSTKTFGHSTLNINFYNDFTSRTQLSGFKGLEVFMLGNLKSNYSDLSANQGVPSF
ncbi:MAG: DUF4251 domain-containing protein [Cyclobacteriaceae bacterium]